MDLALFFVIISTLLHIIKIVVENIGLKLTVDNPNCSEEKLDVNNNKLGLKICNYGTLIFNICAIITLIISIASLER